MSLADDFQYQYVVGQMRPDFPALLARFQQASDALAASTSNAQFDQRYGGAEREVYDFFPAQGPVRGHLVYFHAGYWQSRDKALFRWLAGAFAPQGVDVFLVNYPLCPDVALASLTDSARRATRAIAVRVGASGQPLVVAGHSAGAHLATEMALTPGLGLRGEGGAPPNVHAIVALAGIYDLAPLTATTLNDRLRLDDPAARANSPLWRVAGGAPPALFAVGAEETAQFHEQATRMHHAWRAAGMASEVVAVPAAHHFSLLQDWASPTGTLAKPMQRLWDQARRAAIV